MHTKETERMIGDVQIKLAALWVALMLTYLLGDVMRIFSGDFRVEDIEAMQLTQMAWLGMAIVMVIPVIMTFLTLIMKYAVNRWVNIILAILYFGMNLSGITSYPSLFDQFLIIVGLVFNVLTVWYAWRWSKLYGHQRP